MSPRKTLPSCLSLKEELSKGVRVKVLVIGSGPIRIGQACEFDYSCTQACQALRENNIETVLLNSNPASIMTDPETADTVYLEPLTPRVVQDIVQRERVTHILPTMGGQEGLNLILALEEEGLLEGTGVQILGIETHTIRTAEDRALFRELIESLGLRSIRGITLRQADLEQLDHLCQEIRFPAIVRASFTLGGGGGGIAETMDELKAIAQKTLNENPKSTLLVEESLIGWKEFELEVMTDHKRSFVVVAAVENVNPMGVHTGDSITVVPPVTLRDRELQQMRSMAQQIFAKLNMKIGGANIQFAVDPSNGEIVVVEMNPRVSRSSALVSKATGYPIARVSTLLAIGYDLDEVQNPIIEHVSAAMEPVIDYVALKFPRFDTQKFTHHQAPLGITMKSVGEVLSFGTNYDEAFRKAWASLEMPNHRLSEPLESKDDVSPFFLHEEPDLKQERPETWASSSVLKCRLVDTCAGEFPARSPYYFLSGEDVQDEFVPFADRGKGVIVVIGSGPNRVGQGIEFDTACVQALRTIRKLGYRSVMINCNPETVSTDYSEADRLYFEPIVEQSVLCILAKEKADGVFLQFGGQSALKVAEAIDRAGFHILGSPLTVIEKAENRSHFEQILKDVGLHSPPSREVTAIEDVEHAARELNLPLLLRPSFVIGGQGMRIASTLEALHRAIVTLPPVSAKNPLIVQEFALGGHEYDVDLICEDHAVHILGVLKHIDPPGVHSGDSIGELVPPSQLAPEIRDAAIRLARGMGAKGFLNIQLISHNQDVAILEANPRMARSVPFIDKAQGMKSVDTVVRLCLNEESAWRDPPDQTCHFFKFPVFPYGKFKDLHFGPGPEMHSLGEVMGWGQTRLEAFGKGLSAAGAHLPKIENIESSGELRILFDSQESLNLLKTDLSELNFALKSLKAEIVNEIWGPEANDPAENGYVGIVLMPRYIELLAESDARKALLPGQVAGFIGAGIPTALSEEASRLLLSSCVFHLTSPNLAPGVCLGPLSKSDVNNVSN